MRPRPSLAYLEVLAERVREAGLPVELHVEGEAKPLPPGVDLSAYRIVQEALTNALKHAGPASAQVVVRYRPEEVELEISDDGRGPVGGREGGHGLVGMRERAALVGGERRERKRRRARLHRPRTAARMTIKVLIADDQALVRTGFRKILESEPDLEVVGEAGDGGEAVEASLLLRPDVVLMDIRMPRLDGLEATRRLAGQDARAVLTTFDLNEYVYEALRAGASGFLLKDAPADQLVTAIRVVAAGEALLAPVHHQAPDRGVRAPPALERPAGRARGAQSARARGPPARRARALERRDRQLSSSWATRP